MDSTKSTLLQEGLTFIYEPSDILINMALAFVLGLFISYIYKATHKGLSYSQSFMLTIVFVTFIVAMVMMVIGNNLARAFALVGALSIIRFRTVIKRHKGHSFYLFGSRGRDGYRDIVVFSCVFRGPVFWVNRARFACNQL